MKPEFDITLGKGFHITFQNGWTVSVQFGAGNYCDHRRNYSDPSQLYCGPSTNAEIAAFKGDDWHKFGDRDTVKGYCTPEDVARFICEVSGWS